MFIDPTLLWVIIGGILLGGVFIIPQVELLIAATGAFIAAALALIPGIHSSFILQTSIWLVSSGLSFLLLRKKFAKIFKGKLITKDNEDNTGNKAVVIKEITPDSPGRVKYQGTSWKAISYSETFSPGETVEILKTEGLSLIVTKSILGGFDDLDKIDNQ